MVVAKKENEHVGKTEGQGGCIPGVFEKKGVWKMISEKDLTKTKFFTTNGTDIWKITHIRTVTVVELASCETGQTGTIRLGEQSSIGFVPVIMPKIKRQKSEIRSQRSEVRNQKSEKKKEKTGEAGAKAGKTSTPGRGRGAGKNAKSKYLGVRVKTRAYGRKKYTAQVVRNGKYTGLGTYNTEEDAAAAVQEHLGNTEEAARLRKLAEQKTDEEIAELKGQTAWDCTNCGKGYQYKPDQCGKCGHSSFTKARPEIRNQRSDFRNQKSEIRLLKSEV